MRHQVSIVLAFAILFGALGCLRPTEPNTKASPSDHVQVQNGSNLVDTPNMKSTNGFGALLLLTDDDQIFDNWNAKNDGIEVQSMRQVKRGKPFFTVVIFTNPGTDSKKQCNVTGDITIRKPDDTVYGAMTNVNFWTALPAPKSGELQLAVDYMGIVIEKKDPPGKYRVEVTVRDKIKKVEIVLSDFFVVEQNK